MITSISDRIEMIESMDTHVFDHIYSQTSDDDRRSLLALQTAVRSHFGEYSYLEIGSYLGGSLQPHLIDPCCRRIYSIDLRPAKVPDVRDTIKSYNYTYSDNSTNTCSGILK